MSQATNRMIAGVARTAVICDPSVAMTAKRAIPMSQKRSRASRLETTSQIVPVTGRSSTAPTIPHARSGRGGPFAACSHARSGACAPRTKVRAMQVRDERVPLPQANATEASVART